MPLTASPSTRRSADMLGADPDVLQQIVLKTVTSLLPSIVQTVQQQLASQPRDTAGKTDETAPGDDDPFDADSQDLAEADDAGNLVDVPAGELCQQYSAMSADCQRAYRAGWARGAALTDRYARHADLHKVVARQQARLQELSDQIARERRAATRYAKLTELSREYAFDPREEAETCGDMTDTQFERHCTATIVKYARRDDVTNVELFTDPTVRVDGSGGAACRANVAQIERYSREAAAIAARKNASKRGSTTFEAEFDALCRQHGVSV